MVLWIGPILRAVTGQERQRPGHNAYYPNAYQTPYPGQYPGPNSHHHHHHHPQPQAPVGYAIPAMPQPLDRWERKQARKADRLARKAQRHGLPMPVVVAAPAPAPAPYGYDYGRPMGQMPSSSSRAGGSGNRAGTDFFAEPPAGPPPKSARGHAPDRRASLDEEDLGSESDLPPSYDSAVAGPSRRRSVEVLSSGQKGGR